MALVAVSRIVDVEFTYEEGQGPVRDGNRKHKPALGPTLQGNEGVEDLLNLMEGVCEWGQAKFHADHGGQDEHIMLLNMLNLVLKLMPEAAAIAADQFDLT